MLDIVNRRLRVFLCHSSTDKEVVRNLYKQLLSDGIDAWLDKENLLPGQEWQEEIPKAVKNSDIVIVCLSKNSINKDGYIQKEIKFALDIANEKPEGTIYIIPVRLENCDVPEKFSKYNWADLFEKSGYKKLLRALILRGDQIGVIVPSYIDESVSLPISTSEIQIQFREEILKPFFNYIKSGESFYIIGSPSMGKTRFIDFVMENSVNITDTIGNADHNRVKSRYLGNDVATQTWLIHVNINRIGANLDWGFLFYELLLHTTLLACFRNPQTKHIEEIKQSLSAYHLEVIKNKDGLIAHRFFEMAINMLCQLYNVQICFFFDEFDEIYRTMPREILSQLRAIRDSNKYRICYILFLRNLPATLRDPLDNESFYELISRAVIGFGPYSKHDTFKIIEQLEKWHNFTPPLNTNEWIYMNSGGYPGLIQILFVLLKEQPNLILQAENLEALTSQESIREEFRKFRAGLLREELEALEKISQGDQSYVSPEIAKLLLTRGLIKSVERHMVCFTPLFEYLFKNQFQTS